MRSHISWFVEFVVQWIKVHISNNEIPEWRRHFRPEEEKIEMKKGVEKKRFYESLMIGRKS